MATKKTDEKDPVPTAEDLAALQAELDAAKSGTETLKAALQAAEAERDRLRGELEKIADGQAWQKHQLVARAALGRATV